MDVGPSLFLDLLISSVDDAGGTVITLVAVTHTSARQAAITSAQEDLLHDTAGPAAVAVASLLARTATCWSGVFRRAGGAEDVSTDFLSPEQLSLTLQRMARRTPGPDDLDFLLLQLYQPQLAPTLAQCLTHAAVPRHGLGADSPLRQSEMLLFPSPGAPPVNHPSAYRPPPCPCWCVCCIRASTFSSAGPTGRLLLTSTGQGAQAPAFPPPPPSEFAQPQAGFESGRGCTKQALLVQLVQPLAPDHSYKDSPTRYAAILDLTQAYDSMEYAVLLRHHPRPAPLPARETVEVLRKLLPGNRTTILDHTVAFKRGLPQGGALCPFLCQASMDTLVGRLEGVAAGLARCWKPPEVLP